MGRGERTGCCSDSLGISGAARGRKEVSGPHRALMGSGAVSLKHPRLRCPGTSMPQRWLGSLGGAQRRVAAGSIPVMLAMATQGIKGPLESL